MFKLSTIFQLHRGGSVLMMQVTDKLYHIMLYWDSNRSTYPWFTAFKRSSL